MTTLVGKTVLVTGSSRGIGAEVARQAAAAGARILLVARDAEALELVATQIRSAGGEAWVYPTDLADFAALDALAAEVEARHAGVDVLVHNAGRSIRRPLAASLDRFHDFERTMQINYFAPVRLTLALLPALRDRRGSVSLVLSFGALIPGPYFAAYLASKAALAAFGDVLAAEFAAEGIHVSAVYLPLVKTQMMAPTKAYTSRTDALSVEQAAEWILRGIVKRERRVMSGQGVFFGTWNLLGAGVTTGMLSGLFGAFPPKGEPVRKPGLRRLLKRRIGGSPL